MKSRLPVIELGSHTARSSLQDKSIFLVSSTVSYLMRESTGDSLEDEEKNCIGCKRVFDVLAYTGKEVVAVPFTWIESDPKLIANAQMVKLHSFDAKIYKVDTLVSYNNDEWDEK